MEAKVKKIQEWLDTHDDKPGKQGKVKKSHLIDNESAKMMSSHGVVQGYNGIAGVDAKHQIIVKAGVYDGGSEQETLTPMVEGIEETFKAMGEEDIYRKAKVTADSGFHSGENMKMLKDKEIDAYVADNQFRKRDPRYAGAKKYKEGQEKKERQYYGPDDFSLDEGTGKLICPAGNKLYVKSRNFRTGNGFYGMGYKAKVTDCRVCELRAKCLQNPNTVARQVHRFEGRDMSKKPVTVSQWMRERIDTVRGRYLYSLRMGIVEPVFANIRDNLGLDRFTLRGRMKVNAQWKMFTMVHNMLKAYRYGWNTAGAG